MNSEPVDQPKAGNIEIVMHGGTAHVAANLRRIVEQVAEMEVQVFELERPALRRNGAFEAGAERPALATRRLRSAVKQKPRARSPGQMRAFLSRLRVHPIEVVIQAGAKNTFALTRVDLEQIIDRIGVPT